MPKERCESPDSDQRAVEIIDRRRQGATKRRTSPYVNLFAGTEERTALPRRRAAAKAELSGLPRRRRGPSSTFSVGAVPFETTRTRRHLYCYSPIGRHDSLTPFLYAAIPERSLESTPPHGLHYLHREGWRKTVPAQPRPSLPADSGRAPTAVSSSLGTAPQRTTQTAAISNSLPATRTVAPIPTPARLPTAP